MKRGTPTGRHLASGSSLDRFSTRSLKVFRVQGRNGTSTCLSALFTPFQLVSATLPLKPGYHAPFPPKSGRPSGKCGAGPATALRALSSGSAGGKERPGIFGERRFRTDGRLWGKAGSKRQPRARQIKTPPSLGVPFSPLAIHLRRLALLLQVASAAERVQHHVIAFVAGVLVNLVASDPACTACEGSRAWSRFWDRSP